MKLTHRIVELDNGFFTVERYAPWFFFGVEMPKWEGYFNYDGYDIGTVSSYSLIKFNTQEATLRWMRERFGDDNVKCENICAVLGVK
jgi:hypothetical protein